MKILRKITASMLLGLMLAGLSGGQVPSVPTNKTNEPVMIDTVPAGTSELTAADVEAFLDGIVPLQLEREDIAGATVSVVKDGKLLFAKGYGYADVKNKKAVSAAETLFRPGSISKLFVWTAIMQLAERGKLDLDRDINEYLDFQIPEAFGQPITLKNILTHTPGFEEQVKDLFALDKPSPDLGEYVKTHIPRRIFAPGTMPAYSNYATTLAGYIVERASGQSFNEYVEQNIFQPLGMTRSTFRQPLPPELAPHMSSGYVLASEEAKPFETIGPFPAGSMSSTATDISKFMLAHLQEGRLGEAQILKPETARLMHSPLFSLDPAANAMCYGFYEESRNGRRIIGHGGDTVQFHSDLHLIPDAGLGFFVSYNSAGRGQISPRTILWEAFLDRYFPDSRPDNAPTLESARENARAISGTYMISRRGESSFVKLLAVLGETSVAANDDGTIQVAGLNDPNGKPKRWREVAPFNFRDVGGGDTLIFKPDSSGRMQIVLPYPFMAFQRVGFWENSRILLPVVGLSLLMMALTLVLWFVAWLVRRHYGGKLELTAWERRFRIAVRLVFALDLIFTAAFAVFAAAVADNFELLSDSGTKWLRLIQIFGVLGAVGTIVVFAHAVHAWLSGRYRLWGKLQALIFVASSLGFLWFVWAGNLLSFSSNY